LSSIGDIETSWCPASVEIQISRDRNFLICRDVIQRCTLKYGAKSTTSSRISPGTSRDTPLKIEQIDTFFDGLRLIEE